MIIMDRDILNQVLQYPLVQYITLLRRDLIKVNNIFPNQIKGDIRVNLYTSRRTLNQAYSPSTNSKDHMLLDINFNERFAIIAYNYDIKDLKYRTTQITVIGKPTPKLYYLFTIDRRLFYRHKVFFRCFNMYGEKIDTSFKVYSIPLSKK